MGEGLPFELYRQERAGSAVRVARFETRYDAIDYALHRDGPEPHYVVNLRTGLVVWQS